MLSWGAKRRLVITAVFVALLLILLASLSIKTFNHPASCSDGKQNQGELGVDCGGPCARLCVNQTAEPVVLWQRAFPVSQGIYNAAAYVQNLNGNSGAQNVSYSFKLYDKNGILVAERVGTASIPPQQVSPIFEGAISTGNRVVSRVVFGFESVPVWVAVPNGALTLRVANQLPPADIQTTPLINATIVNDNDVAMSHIPVVAIVYDGNDNASQASQTLIDHIDAHSSVPVSFSWPAPFNFLPIRVEIISEPYPGVSY